LPGGGIVVPSPQVDEAGVGVGVLPSVPERAGGPAVCGWGSVGAVGGGALDVAGGGRDQPGAAELVVVQVGDRAVGVDPLDG
jgi:hypothetical protein